MDIDKDDFREGIEKAVEEQSGLRIGETNEIPFTELFPEEFMQLYTEFDSIEAFFEASQWDLEGEDELDDIPEGELDSYVDEHTEFSEWEVMFETAMKQLLERRTS